MHVLLGTRLPCYAVVAGNKRTNTVHSKDQVMKLGNAALLYSHNAEDFRAGLPVRVLRGHKVPSAVARILHPHVGECCCCRTQLDGRKAPDFAPLIPMGYDKAYRYDGTYKVAEFKEEKDENGFGVYKFRMVRDDPEPPVWSEAVRPCCLVGCCHHVIVAPNIRRA